MNVVNPDEKRRDGVGIPVFVMDYLKQRWSVLINEDYSKLFKKVDIMEILKQKQSQQEVSGDQTGMVGGAQSAAGVRKKPLRAAVQ